MGAGAMSTAPETVMPSGKTSIVGDVAHVVAGVKCPRLLAAVSTIHIEPSPPRVIATAALSGDVYSVTTPAVVTQASFPPVDSTTHIVPVCPAARSDGVPVSTV